MCNCRVRNSGDNFHIIDNNALGDILTRGPRGGRKEVEGEEGYLLVGRVNREIVKPAQSVYINS